ncbi:hypothetical protein L7F22_050686 [Adiantum nelumboides]|nr:hypothetical protein [Adiantum nelumboides]
MTLRSGLARRRQVIHEDGSSRILPLTSPKKHFKQNKHCIFADDEAVMDRSMDGASNTILVTPEVSVPSQDRIALTPQSRLLCSLDFDSKDITVSNDEDDLLKHNRVFGENVPLGLMNDVTSQFHVNRGSDPPLVPLCRLVAIDAMRTALADTSWLVPLFVRAAYVPTMGCFMVSLKGRHGETKMVTQDMIDRWDPIWQILNIDFEIKLDGDWKDLQGRAFFVWDRNHRLKIWIK